MDLKIRQSPPIPIYSQCVTCHTTPQRRYRCQCGALTCSMTCLDRHRSLPQNDCISPRYDDFEEEDDTSSEENNLAKYIIKKKC